MCMHKTSISIRIQKFGRGPLRIFQLDGQIQGEVVVGKTPSEPGSSITSRYRAITQVCQAIQWI